MNETLDPTSSVFNAANVGGFWQWAFSNLAANTLRGIFAEYIVGLALGVIDKPRVEWDAFDLQFNDIGVEVKCAADNQTWKQDKPSVIRFDIAEKRSWIESTNEYTDKSRSAQVYVFAHYTGPADNNGILTVDNWQFYVASTNDLNESFGTQASIGLKAVQDKFGPPVSWDQLAQKVESICVTVS